MGLTKEEHKARAIAGRLVNALAEVQAFFGDADLIFDDAERIAPKSPCQRVVRVLQRQELHSTIGKTPSKWHVYVPESEYIAAYKIVWGPDA